MQKAYQYLAPYYDQLINQDYDIWLAYLRSLWEDYAHKPGNVLELGCGTGNIAIPLAQMGLRVTGVDRSAAMLKQAKAKAEKIGVGVNWVLQSFDQLNLDDQFDLIIAPCDGLNYVTELTALKNTFVRAHEHLTSAGLFMFDLNSEWKLAEIYGDQFFADIYPDFAYFWDNQYQAESGTCQMELTFFIKNGQDTETYQRVTELHQQKLWKPEVVRNALSEAGFELAGYFGFPTTRPPEPECERWQFVASKK